MHAAYMQKHMFVIVIVFVAARNLSLSLSLSQPPLFRFFIPLILSLSPSTHMQKNLWLTCVFRWQIEIEPWRGGFAGLSVYPLNLYLYIGSTTFGDDHVE
jgi:hypothetical protein